MIIMGTITESSTEHSRDNDVIESIDLGVKKPSRGTHPTFFRVSFIREKSKTPLSEINELHPGDQVTIEAVDRTLRMVWEIDNIGRSFPVIRVAGNTLTPGTTPRITNHF